MEEIELVGVVDIDEEQAKNVANECNTLALTDYSELLDKVDAVSIAVPTLLHHEITRTCLEHRIDVMVEKPFTTSLEEADELIALARQNDCIIQVGHLERFNPAVIATHPLLTHPLFIEAHRISVFKNRGTDVDVILDLMIHDIDIILSIVQSPLKTIHTVGAPVVTDLTDIANARLIFENGCTANVTVSRISMDNIRRMRIFQPGTYISVDFAKREVMAIRPKTDRPGGMLIPEINKYNFHDQDVLELELRDFITHVRQRSKPQVAGEEGRRALQVALDVVAQIQVNREQVTHLLGPGGNLAGL
jgi:predicted dehydrogenase